MTTVAVLVGSLRKGSFSRKVANALAALTPSLKFEFLDIGSVSYFNQDLEAAPPADWTALREGIAAADAVLFVTAEYNRSVPGVLKNAIDVASRPYGQGALSGKPAAIISMRKYCNARSRMPYVAPVLINRPAAILFVIRLPLIYWKTATISVPYRNCWVIKTSARR